MATARAVTRMTMDITAQTTALTLSPMLTPAAFFCSDPSNTKAMIDRMRAGIMQASNKAQNAPQQNRLKTENKREHRAKQLVSTSGAGTRVMLGRGGTLLTGIIAGIHSTSSLAMLVKA